MKISVQDGKQRFAIILPNLMIFSRFSSEILRRASKKYGGTSLNIPPIAMRKIRKCIRQMRKTHQNWYLIEADDADGSSVRIKL